VRVEWATLCGGVVQKEDGNGAPTLLDVTIDAFFVDELPAQISATVVICVRALMDELADGITEIVLELYGPSREALGQHRFIGMGGVRNVPDDLPANWEAQHVVPIQIQAGVMQTGPYELLIGFRDQTPVSLPFFVRLGSLE